jgi:hypothetical protein
MSAGGSDNSECECGHEREYEFDSCCGGGGAGEEDDGGAGEQDDDAGAPGDDPPPFQLQMRILELESEVRTLRAQLAGQREMVELLQCSIMDGSAGADGVRRAFAGDADGETPPLLVAARAGDVPMLGVLLTATEPPALAMLNAALLVACEHAHTAAAARLLDAGASVHADHDSALLWACRNGCTDLARTLLLRGANPRTLNGCPLRIAARAGNVEIATLLSHTHEG